ncbi:MAG: hypothetical protein EPN92_02645 [Chitinophagaceae bacterium]|nr:MAG: hypothetical protein EPN92_02645 [Chitinophagaceae bacterium]
MSNLTPTLSTGGEGASPQPSPQVEREHHPNPLHRWRGSITPTLSTLRQAQGRHGGGDTVRSKMKPGLIESPEPETNREFLLKGDNGYTQEDVSKIKGTRRKKQRGK